MRSRLLTIRVDDREHAVFKAAAAGVGVSISVFARDAMMARIALEAVASPVGVLVASPGEAVVVGREAARSRSAPGVKPCRHGIASCRICKTGVYA
jgi:hypothetical protein